MTVPPTHSAFRGCTRFGQGAGSERSPAAATAPGEVGLRFSPPGPFKLVRPWWRVNTIQNQAGLAPVVAVQHESGFILDTLGTRVATVFWCDGLCYGFKSCLRSQTKAQRPKSIFITERAHTGFVVGPAQNAP